MGRNPGELRVWKGERYISGIFSKEMYNFRRGFQYSDF